MIDLSAVDALIAVDRTGTVHAAARDLGYTPSAVSQQVKRLERDLGARLLDREGRGVVLTSAGRRVVEEGRALREQVESLRARLHDAGARPTGTVRLALPPSLRGEELFRDEADVLVHASSPLARREVLTPADLVDETWVCTPDGTICYEWFCHMFAREPRVPRIDFRCLEFASQVEVVAHGLAVALVPRLGRGVLPADVVAVPVREPVPTRPVTVVWRATMTDAPAVRYLRERLREAR